MASLADTIAQVGIAAWGGSMPVLSPTWTDSAMPSANDDTMSLSLGAGEWRAPLAGTVAVAPAGGSLPLTLLGADGTPLPGTGALVLTLYPQAYLRLARLYAQVLEDASGARPERARGLPFRPVPLHARYPLPGGSVPAGGNVDAGDGLGVSGTVTFHDAAGMPIDPLAVASVFTALMASDNVLQKRSLGAAFDPNHQVAQIAALATPAVTRLRLADHAGAPYDGAHLQGITAVAAASGLFTLSASSVTKDAAGASFPEAERRLVKLGPATTGRLDESFTPPQFPAGATALTRDFYSLRVVELGGYLRGTPNPSWDGTKVHDPPEVRLNEPAVLVGDGNDVLAAGAVALAGTPAEALAVAEAIDGAFPAPPARGPAAHWPGFPATAGSPAAGGPLAIALRDSFAPTGGFLDDGNAATANVDVVITLNGLPAEAHVRVYPRVFGPDARESRGDGAAGIARGGTLTLLLRDPLRLRIPGVAESTIIIPTGARLALDVVVVKRTGEARVYGNVVVALDPPGALTVPAAPGSNAFGTAARRGVSNAGVLGLTPPPLPSGTTDLLAVLVALTGEGIPRDASRLPMMAHRELIVAGQSAGAWRAVLSGGRLAAELHSADARLGTPGGLGGRETQAIGLAADPGQLAWDLGRAAFRRTTRFDQRLLALAGSAWDQPAEASATAGSVAAAALQTIAPACATPELYVLRTTGAIDPDSTTRPQTFDDLVDWVKNNLVPGGVPRRQDILDALDNLKDDTTLSESTKERLFNETEREVMTAAYGRRDAQWALKDAIRRARRFIYIETPGFTPTQRDYAGHGETVPPYAADLIAAIAARMNAAPGLHVAICTPKFPDFGRGYERAAAYEAAARRTAIRSLPTAQDASGSRVFAFHPIGFPGRRSRLEATAVIVDDTWALIGASTFRRRGLTFDGATDVALTDMALEEGICPSLRDFRRTLLATRLGISPTSPSTFGAMPDPSFVRLADGVEACLVIREQLLAGGLGRIEPLWNGIEPGLPTITPFEQDLSDPDGEAFDLPSALAAIALASLSTALLVASDRCLTPGWRVARPDEDRRLLAGPAGSVGRLVGGRAAAEPAPRLAAARTGGYRHRPWPAPGSGSASIRSRSARYRRGRRSRGPGRCRRGRRCSPPAPAAAACRPGWPRPVPGGPGSTALRHG